MPTDLTVSVGWSNPRAQGKWFQSHNGDNGVQAKPGGNGLVIQVTEKTGGRRFQMQGQCGIESEFKARLRHLVGPCLKMKSSGVENTAQQLRAFVAQS